MYSLPRSRLYTFHIFDFCRSGAGEIAPYHSPGRTNCGLCRLLAQPRLELRHLPRIPIQHNMIKAA